MLIQLSNMDRLDGQLRKINDCKHIEVAEFYAVLKGVVITALGLGLHTLEIWTGSVTVHGRLAIMINI